MKDKQYYLYINGKPIKVSEEVYREYKRSEDKEKYFMKNLKRGKLTVDMENETVKYIPSREVSYEEYVKLYGEFKSLKDITEDSIIKFDISEKLQSALDSLSNEERELIDMLFYSEKTEREAAKLLNVSQNTVNYRKNKILEKLRCLLEKIF